MPEKLKLEVEVKTARAVRRLRRANRLANKLEATLDRLRKDGLQIVVK